MPRRPDKMGPADNEASLLYIAKPDRTAILCSHNIRVTSGRCRSSSDYDAAIVSHRFYAFRATTRASDHFVIR